MTNNQIPHTSPDIQAERLAKLKQLFPDLFDHEGNLDENELKALVQNYSVPQVEKFVFQWAGKQHSKKMAFRPSKGTLEPDRERSVDFDQTKNLIIEGDNLEVLKLLRNSYFEQVKCIYIDPPYNTGNDFIYPDNFTEDKKAYWEKNGQVKDGVKLDTNSESKGRYHSDWLNMMQSRLLLSRNLLREDGVIFVSIDDNEVHNLRKLMDEVFGEENFVAILPTIMNLKGNNDEYGFAGTHEYTLVFAKNKDLKNCLGEFSLDEEDEDGYDQQDDLGVFKQGATLMRTGEAGDRKKRPKGYYPIYVRQDLSDFSLIKKNANDFEVFPKTLEGKEMSWRRSPKKLMLEKSEIIILKTQNGISFYKKQRLELSDGVRGKKPKTIFYKPEYSSGNGTNQIKGLFEDKIFDNPKPLALIKDFCELGLSDKDSIILDFFAGSGTTAQAVMELNAEDGGNRKYILVQIPEYTDEKSEAFKAGYKTIFDICRERVKRAGAKIKEENPSSRDQNKKLDTGFKVFRLTHSTFPENLWAPDPDKTEEENIKVFDDYLKQKVETTLFDFEFEKLLFEIAIKDGFDLNFRHEIFPEFTKNKVFVLSDPRGKEALICLDEILEEETIKQIASSETDKRFIYLARAVDTTKKWTLHNALGKKLLWEV